MNSAPHPAIVSPPPAIGPGARIAIYAAGSALFVASLLFVGLSAARNWTTITSVQIPVPGWLLVSAALYAISHVSTGVTWPLALRRMGESIQLTEGVRIGLVAQIGKYLPGNVAHYFGRGALARSAGISLKVSGLSTGVELVSALAAAVIVSGIAALIEPRPLAVLPSLGVGATIVGSAMLLAALAFALWVASRGHGPRLFVAPVLCLTISLLLSGLSLASLVWSLGDAAVPVTIILSAVALAWVAGFLVPGAPAGIGIREAILIAILSAEIGAAGAVAAALLHRLVTAAVDVAAACAGYAWTSGSVFSKK